MAATITDQSIKGFKKEIIKRLQSQILRSNQIIFKEIKEFVNKVIEYHVYESESVTINSMLHLGGGPDNLRRDLGLTFPEDKIQTIVDLMKQSIKIRIKIVGDSIQVKIGVSENLFENLLLNPAALQEATLADGSQGKVAYIPWLEWLLEKGGERGLAPGYYVKKSKPSRRGRSGEIGFMFPTHGDREEFQIPARHRGVPGNNFITKILDNVGETMEKNILGVIESAIERILSRV